MGNQTSVENLQKELNENKATAENLIKHLEHLLKEEREMHKEEREMHKEELKRIYALVNGAVPQSSYQLKAKFRMSDGQSFTLETKDPKMIDNIREAIQSVYTRMANVPHAKAIKASPVRVKGCSEDLIDISNNKPKKH